MITLQKNDCMELRPLRGGDLIILKQKVHANRKEHNPDRY
jgi:hypothetical protein